MYGHPALGISLPWALELSVAPVAGAGDPGPPPKVEVLAPLPEQLAAMIDAPHLRAVVEVRSQIPIGLGFGSSAALCVAAERALAHFAASSTARSSTAEWYGAHKREQVFHGTPSGADTGLAALPGVGFLSWQRSGELPSCERIPATELHLVVAAVPRRGDTMDHVAAVAQRVRWGDPEARDALRRLGECSTEARALLRGAVPQANAIGALADHAQRLLAGLGLGDPAQERLLRAGRSAGASGGKLSGAGGGGACFLVCRDATTATSVLGAVRAHATAAAHIMLSAGPTIQQAPDARTWTTNRWLHAPRGRASTGRYR